MNRFDGTAYKGYHGKKLHVIDHWGKLFCGTPTDTAILGNDEFGFEPEELVDRLKYGNGCKICLRLLNSGKSLDSPDPKF